MYTLHYLCAYTCMTVAGAAPRLGLCAIYDCVQERGYCMYVHIHWVDVTGGLVRN